MNTQTSEASFRQLTIDNPVIVTALAYDPVNRRIYWGDNYANTISRMPLNGNGGVGIVVGWVKTPFWMSYLVSEQQSCAKSLYQIVGTKDPMLRYLM